MRTIINHLEPFLKLDNEIIRTKVLKDNIKVETLRQFYTIKYKFTLILFYNFLNQHDLSIEINEQS